MDAASEINDNSDEAFQNSPERLPALLKGNGHTHSSRVQRVPNGTLWLCSRQHKEPVWGFSVLLSLSWPTLTDGPNTHTHTRPHVSAAASPFCSLSCLLCPSPLVPLADGLLTLDDSFSAIGLLFWCLFISPSISLPVSVHHSLKSC